MPEIIAAWALSLIPVFIFGYVCGNNDKKENGHS